MTKLCAITWDSGGILLPEGSLFTGLVRKAFGLAPKPKRPSRPSKGYRRHVRRMKGMEGR